MFGILSQQLSEVFEGTELHFILAVEGLQGWVCERAQLMLSVSRLGEVIRALSTAALWGVAGVARVHHQLGRDHGLLRAWGSAGQPGSQGMAEGSLQVGDGHVLAHGA